MSEYIEVHWSSGSIDEARKVCRFLVQEGYVACAQIVPWIESIYLWNNQLETTQESKVSLKTHKDLFEKIKQVIIENSSYQIPEITFQYVDGGSDEYLQWITNALRKGPK